MATVVNSNEEFLTTIKETKDKLIVVDFFTTWCGPCKMITPWLEEFKKQYPNVLFLKVDAEKLQETAQKYNVASYPSLVYILNQKEIFRVVGANKERIETVIKAVDPKDAKLSVKLSKLQEKFDDSLPLVELFILIVALIFLSFTPYWVFWW
eukprot:gene9681-1887_t